MIPPDAEIPTGEKASDEFRDKTIAYIEQRLLTCHRRLRRALATGLFIEYLLAAALAVAIASALFLAIKLILVMAGPSESVVVWTNRSYAATLATALIAIAVILALRLARRLPSFIAAAERLDRSARDHNRVATALWLLQDGHDPDSPFCKAAIRDGVEYVELLWKTRPDTTTAIPALGQYRLRFISAGLLFLLSLATIISPLPMLRPIVDGSHESADPSKGRLVAVESPLASTEKNETKTSPPAETRASDKDESDSNSSKAGQSPRNGRRPDARHNPADNSHGKSSAAARSETGGGSAGQSTEAGVSNASNSKKKKTSELQKRSKRKPASARTTPNNKQKENQLSSSATGSGSSGGSMQVVQNSWSLQDRATRWEETEEDDEGEAEEEEQQSSKQRGGIQPSLKDRNQAPSRELGIGEGDGPPGTGRGGPTPPKKSRGTASMVLGVPMPDFVKGRMGPGPTKTTQEQVTPSPQTGQEAAAVGVEKRSLAENPISRFNVRAGDSELVRRYLMKIHSSDKRKTKQSDPQKQPTIKR